MKVLDTYIDYENVGENGEDDTWDISQLSIRCIALAFVQIRRSSHQKISVEVLATNTYMDRIWSNHLEHAPGLQRIEFDSITFYFSSTLAFGFGPLLFTRRVSGLLI